MVVVVVLLGATNHTCVVAAHHYGQSGMRSAGGNLTLDAAFIRRFPRIGQLAAAGLARASMSATVVCVCVCGWYSTILSLERESTLSQFMLCCPRRGRLVSGQPPAAAVGGFNCAAETCTATTTTTAWGRPHVCTYIQYRRQGGRPVVSCNGGGRLGPDEAMPCCGNGWTPVVESRYW